MNKKVLVLFEISGAVSVPFRESGFDVLTVDILPHCVDNEHHIIYDISRLDDLGLDYSSFDLLVAFPPCTYFSKAGLHHMHKNPDRYYRQMNDLKMILNLWSLPIKFKIFENPGGSALNKLWCKCDCLIDYCQFADYKKPTCLWLSNLPPLLPVQYNIKKYGKFITRMSGVKKRNFTPIEVGYAMVNQYSSFILNDT